MPPAPGVDVREVFYRWAPPRGRRHARLAQHVPDMLRYRRVAREADVVHFQWLSVQALDTRLLPAKRPRVLTAHDVLPREPKPSQLAGQRALYERMDAVIVHSEHGAGRLRDEVGLDPAKVHVIPHGVLDNLVSEHGHAAVRQDQARGAVLRPDPALQGPRRAARGVARARTSTRSCGSSACRAWTRRSSTARTSARRCASSRTPSSRAPSAPPTSSCCPYREIDQSGVLFTAMAFEKPLLLTRVGGFPEIEGAELVPPDDPDALATRCARCWTTRRGWSAWPASHAAEYGWDAIARRTLELYAGLQA